MINLADLGNGLFEAVGGGLLYSNVYRLYKDKMLKGVFWAPTAFFTAWGYWNCFYYPHLNQWFSFTGGLLVVSANSIWVYLALKYRKNDGSNNNKTPSKNDAPLGS